MMGSFCKQPTVPHHVMLFLLVAVITIAYGSKIRVRRNDGLCNRHLFLLRPITLNCHKVKYAFQHIGSSQLQINGVGICSIELQSRIGGIGVRTLLGLQHFLNQITTVI